MKCFYSFFITLIVSLISFVHIAASDYVIYPLPQDLKYISCKAVTVEKIINVVCEKGIDQYTKNRLKEIFEDEHAFDIKFSNKASSKYANVYLGVYGSCDMVDKYVKHRKYDISVFSKKAKYDRHYIRIGLSMNGKPEIILLGEHTNAVYYGLASLEQILEQACNHESEKASLKALEINDYADMQYRGIVEGYYGYPYSFDVKKDLISFFKRFKLNTYLYGAKSDPFHSGFWREPYPVEITALQEKNGWLSQRMIKELAKVSIESKVNFIWAIHPNSGIAVDFHSTESTAHAVSDVMGKFGLMYNLGIRQFAVFLDDAGWDFGDVNNYRDFLTGLQSGLEERYNRNFASATDTVLPIHYVPHIYAINFATEKNRKTYFDAISQVPPNIVVYTTGSGVWSSVKNQDFVTMQDLMKRPVSLWWNYPCNDNKDGRVYTADTYSTLQEMGLPIPDKDVPLCLGLVSNPMQQGAVSKICLFGVADYSWNTKAFNNIDNWLASFPAIVDEPNVSLVRYLAEFLRFQDPDELKNMISRYSSDENSSGSEPKADLSALLCSIEDSTKKMLGVVSDDEKFNLLKDDLLPWLRKLNKMADVANVMLNLDEIKDNNKRWKIYCKQIKVLEQFRTDTLYMVAALEGMGENPPSVMHPVEPCGHYLMPFIESLTDGFYKFKKRKVHDYPLLTVCGTDSVITTNNLKVSDGNFYVEMLNPYILQPKESILITLPDGGVPNDVYIDKNLRRNFKIEFSFLGRDYYNVAELHKKQRKIKYIKITNSASKTQSLCLDKSLLRVSMPCAPEVSSVTLPDGIIYGNHNASMLVDGDVNTFTCLSRDQKDGDCYTVKLNEVQPIYDVTIAFGTTNLDFPKAGCVQISTDSVHWRNLNVRGGTDEVFRMTLPQVKKINEDVSSCSFVNDGSSARFVRFYLKESFQEKWLRLNEIEINPSYLSSQFVPVASVDGLAIPEVIDGKANTTFSPDKDDVTIVYNFFGEKTPSELVVYAVANKNVVNNGDSEIQIVCGGKPLSFGSLKDGINIFSLDRCPHATSATIKILNHSFSIAEITEKH